MEAFSRKLAIITSTFGPNRLAIERFVTTEPIDMYVRACGVVLGSDTAGRRLPLARYHVAKL